MHGGSVYIGNNPTDILLCLVAFAAINISGNSGEKMTHIMAQKMKGKLDSKGTLSGGELLRLAETVQENDLSAIQTAAAERLTALGETNQVDKIASALAKQAAGGVLRPSDQGHGGLYEKNAALRRGASHHAGQAGRGQGYAQDVL